jgi:tRNA nucleotidyltransferase (CCA-adding enzyme)
VSPPPPQIDAGSLAERARALPGVAGVSEAAGDSPVYLVGGVVRDLLLGRERADLDLVVEGDAIAIARRLGGELIVHERFGTATVRHDDTAIDLATARAETYPWPGALPEVRPGTLADDLARRDFTINAMALALGDGELVDPHDGTADLDTGVVRVLHEGSFSDDPTRALRAARYAARLGLEPEARTAELLRGADLGTVSADRVEAEVRKLAAEPDPRAGFELAAAWGILVLSEEALALIGALSGLLAKDEWSGLTSPGEAIPAVVAGRTDRASALAGGAAPQAASEGVAVAHGHSGPELAIARAMGAEWLDRYVSDWRHVRLEIGGSDLLRAGVAEGPGVGAGLEAALRAKLDGEAAGSQQELQIAIAAAGAR